MGFGKLSKWESSVRIQMFNVCELSQDIFLLPNLQLCSLTCEMYSTLQWCCSTHRDEGKVISLGLYWVFFAVWTFVYLRRVSATLWLRGAWFLIVVASFVVKPGP